MRTRRPTRAPPPSPRRLRGIWRARAGLVLGGLAAALLVAEGAARLGPSAADLANFGLAGEGNRPGCARPSASRGFEATPGACGADENGARVYAAGPEGTDAARVMVVGDSISTQVTWPAELADRLSERWGGRAVRVEANGVPGYNTCQELSMFRENVERMQPAAVLLQGCANDARGSPVLIRTDGRARLYVDDTELQFPAWFLHSRLLTRAAVRFGSRTPVDFYRGGTELAEVCLAELRAEAAARGLPLFTTLFPLFWQREDAPAPMLADEDTMRALFTASGLPFLDLRPAFEAAGPMVEHRSITTDFLHPNDAGQRVAGAAIAEWMTDALPAP